MMRLLLVLLMALATGRAAADDALKRPEQGSTSRLHDDADDWLPQGGAADLIATRDSNNFERNIYRVGGMLRYESVNDFIAIGVGTNVFRQGAWSARVDSLLATVRKVDPATAAGITASGALAIKGNQVTFHGEGVWNIRLSERTGIELIASRDAIETVEALDSGILASFFALSLDHALTERLTVIGMPTYRHFSDGNEQKGLRGWVIYGLAPDHGLSLNLKARGYASSQNGGGAYFSPDRYERVEIGLRLRHAVGNWRLFATADVGMERINRDTEKPTRQLALSAQRNFDNNVGVGAQFAYYRASDSSSNTGASERYTWRYGRIYLTIPF